MILNHRADWLEMNADEVKAACEARFHHHESMVPACFIGHGDGGEIEANRYIRKKAQLLGGKCCFVNDTVGPSVKLVDLAFTKGGGYGEAGYLTNFPRQEPRRMQVGMGQRMVAKVLDR